MYLFPFIGATLGLSAAILLTSMTQLAYPLVTGGKPILALPAMAVVSYEGTMLGAILFTCLGVIFESRLPKLKSGLYDTRITEGYIGVLASVEDGDLDQTRANGGVLALACGSQVTGVTVLSLIHISEPTRLLSISYSGVWF